MASERPVAQSKASRRSEEVVGGQGAVFDSGCSGLCGRCVWPSDERFPVHTRAADSVRLTVRWVGDKSQIQMIRVGRGLRSGRAHGRAARAGADGVGTSVPCSRPFAAAADRWVTVTRTGVMRSDAGENGWRVRVPFNLHPSLHRGE